MNYITILLPIVHHTLWLQRLQVPVNLPKLFRSTLKGPVALASTCGPNMGSTRRLVISLFDPSSHQANGCGTELGGRGYITGSPP